MKVKTMPSIKKGDTVTVLSQQATRDKGYGWNSHMCKIGECFEVKEIRYDDAIIDLQDFVYHNADLSIQETYKIMDKALKTDYKINDWIYILDTGSSINHHRAIEGDIVKILRIDHKGVDDIGMIISLSDDHHVILEGYGEGGHWLANFKIHRKNTYKIY